MYMFVCCEWVSKRVHFAKYLFNSCTFTYSSVYLFLVHKLVKLTDQHYDHDDRFNTQSHWYLLMPKYYSKSIYFIFLLILRQILVLRYYDYLQKLSIFVCCRKFTWSQVSSIDLLSKIRSATWWKIFEKFRGKSTWTQVNWIGEIEVLH